jgi:molybdate transport system ATP-binding protein
VSAIELAGSVELRSPGRETRLHYDLRTAAGEHLAVVGPNGAGKSTLLRVLAGMVALDKGVLRIDGVTLDDPASKLFVAPDQRPVVLQPQRGALFPHLDVTENVAFPLRAQGRSRRRARRDVAPMLEQLELSELADEKVEGLSGGERARVALARSLAAEPQVLLLDEPAAALDKSATAELRHLLADAPCTLLMVTHDPIEAMLVGRRIAVVEGGTLAAVATPAEISAAPTSPWTARFLGRNLVSGVADGSKVTVDGGGTIVIAERRHGPVHVSFPANAVNLHHDHPEGSARNVWRVHVTRIDETDDRVRVSFTGEVAATALVTEAARRQLDLRPGTDCWASVKATELIVIPA